MPGLDLGVMGGVKAGTTTNGQGDPGATTAMGAGFGPAYDQQSGGGTLWDAFKPNDAFGTSFTIALLAVAALVVIRHSLPR